jgi:Tfp pilus assembly protein PilO
MNKRAPLFVGIVGLVVVILLVLFLVKPKRSEVSEAQANLTTAQEAEQTLQLTLAQLEEAKDQAPETNKQIRDIDTLIPPTEDQPGFILLLQSAADRAGVDPVTIAPGVPVAATTGNYSIISINLDGTGSYFAIEEFLYNLETLPRAAKVLSVNLAPGGASADTATVGTTPVVNELSFQIVVELYTTDLDAGPGSASGSTTTPPVEGA